MSTNFIAKQMFKSQSLFVLWPVVRNTMIFAVALQSLAGCSTMPQAQQVGLSEQNAISTQVNPILAFVESAQAVGGISMVKMSEEVAPVRIRVDRIYDAASGYQCRRYYLSHPQGVSTISAHLACNIGGQWSEVRQLLNTDLTNNS